MHIHLTDAYVNGCSMILFANVVCIGSELRCCIRHFPSCFDKIIYQSNLRREGFILAYGPIKEVPHGGDSTAAGHI